MQFGEYHKNENRKYIGIFDGVKKIYDKEGLVGFFKGISPRMIRKPLSNGIAFTSFEVFHKMYYKFEAF